MPRNVSGTYSPPSADFVTGTVIDSGVMNTKLTDLGDEITDSLSRNGDGGMLARLRGVDGTSNLPAYAFTSETTLGGYRAGADDLRFSSNGTDIIKLGGTGITAYLATTAQKGVTVTNSTSNGAGTTSTGNGSGAGVVGTGGATGNGGTFTAGATSGNGISATGTGAGAGVVATGGPTAGNGVTATGTGAGYGISATGGATGVGGIFQGGATGGTGVSAIGTGGGSGVTAAGQGAGHGISATGGATGRGGVFAAGTAATATDPTVAVELTNGHLLLSGTAPNGDEAFANTLTPANIPKAIAKLTTAGGGSTTVTIASGGFNVSSASTSTTTITVTLGTAVASTGVAHVLISENSGATYTLLPRAKVLGSTVTIKARDIGNAASLAGIGDFNFQADGQTVTLYLVVYGAQ